MLSSILLQAVETAGNLGLGYGVAALGAGRANMILTAALVEGAAFFAMVVGLLVVFK